MSRKLWGIVVCCLVGLCGWIFYDGSLKYTLARAARRRLLDSGLPNALIIGVKKGGTRALIEMLRMHPRISAAQIEVHFFDRDENFRKGLDWYRKQMPQIVPGKEILIEKSPAYFVSPKVPSRVHTVAPHSSLLLLLRNPVSRLVSDFMQGMHQRRGKQIHLATLNRTELEKLHTLLRKRLIREDGTINTNGGLIRIGLYEKHLRRWLAYFAREQIFVASSEELVANPVPILREIEKFLGIDKPTAFRWEDHLFHNQKDEKFFCMNLSGTTAAIDKHKQEKCMDSSKRRDHIPLPRDLEDRLYKFFAPFNERLFSMIGRKFKWEKPTERSTNL